MSREPTFLLDCMRRFLRPEGGLECSSGLDWARLLALAAEHAVEPALYWTLHARVPAGLPADVLDRMHERFRETACVNLMRSAELAKLLALFKQAGIDVLPLKGPTLAEALYGNLALRAFSDLDLLVRRPDVLRAKSVLEANGYALTSTLHWRSGAACLRARESQLSFADARGVSVDVHWRLLPGYFPEAFDADQVWSRRRAVSIGSATAWTLSPEHLLLFLCAHGAKHLWERLGWICDVARLLQVETGIDWAYVFAEADRTHTARMVSLGLVLASELAGVALPPAAERVASDRRARALAAWVRKRFHGGEPTPASTLQAAWFSVRVFERRRYWLRYVFELFFGPSEADYRTMSLPPSVYGLYYLLRPLRFAARAARVGR